MHFLLAEATAPLVPVERSIFRYERTGMGISSHVASSPSSASAASAEGMSGSNSTPW